MSEKPQAASATNAQRALPRARRPPDSQARARPARGSGRPPDAKLPRFLRALLDARVEKRSITRIVRRHHEGTVPEVRAHESAGALARVRVEPRERFVEHDGLPRREERAGKLDEPARAARQRGGGFVDAVGIFWPGWIRCDRRCLPVKNCFSIDPTGGWRPGCSGEVFR